MAFVRVTLQELRGKLGIKTDKNNNIDCPFCKGKKKLHFSDEKQMWHCFGCDASGRTLHFFAMYHLGRDFPSSKTEQKKLSQELIRFMGYDDSHMQRSAPAKTPPRKLKQPASDSQIHAVYSAMASLAMFQLHPDHKKELKRRGLTGAQIERNGYRTYPYKTPIPPEIVNLYNSVDPALKAGFSQKKAAQTQLGLLVANLLEKQGYNLDGIPGFYQFGGHWCLVYTPGILIPTRNVYGQIVLWQVRRSFKPKYITLSCGKLPGAVEEDISRCHFPLANDTLSPENKVIFTEGPLKADIAKALTNDPCVFVAIPGIRNVKDLLKNCRVLRKAGIREMYNALDMDRLTNPHVREGSAKLTAALRNRGMTVIPMYWGERYAAQQLMLYQSIAKHRHVSVPPYDYRLSVYDKLNIVGDALHRADITPGKQLEESQYWEDETKGIDDYLFSLIQRKEHTQSAQKECIKTFHQTLLRINKSSS